MIFAYFLENRDYLLNAYHARTTSKVKSDYEKNDFV